MADFHSLRGYYVSALVRSGASIATVRDLARHAKAETTLKHYAKTELMDLHGAVESLPAARVKINPENLAATGTDPLPALPNRYRLSGAESPQPPDPQPVMSSRQRFAKPLDWETGLGGSNPPLSASELYAPVSR